MELTAERKSIYDDIEVLKHYGLDVEETNKKVIEKIFFASR